MTHRLRAVPGAVSSLEFASRSAAYMAATFHLTCALIVRPQLREMRSRLKAVEVSRDELGVKLFRSEATHKQLQQQAAQLSTQKEVPLALRASITVPHCNQVMVQG